MIINFESYLIQIIAAIVTSIGFGIMFNIKKKNLFHTGIAGGISWTVYLLGRNCNLSDGNIYFLATFSLSLYSEMIARRIKTPVTNILIAALIPLAPGGGVYYTMYNIIEKKYSIAIEKGMNTFVIACAMALGIFTAANIVKIIDKIHKNKG